MRKAWSQELRKQEQRMGDFVIEPILLMQVLTHLWVLNWPLRKGVPVWCLDLTSGSEKKLSGTNLSPDMEGFKRTQPECSRTILRIP